MAIRVAEQRPFVLSIRRVARQPAGDGHAILSEFRLNCFANTLSHFKPACQRCLGHEDDEFLATPARDEIGLSRGMDENVRSCLQQVIPDGMPSLVVDLLEIVEVEDGDEKL
ncbi:MAG: hypothetical protein QM753_21040 [Thermomicrobiales bacterium]